MKFKVGDKVRRLSGGSEKLPVGVETKIIEVKGATNVKVSYDNDWYDEEYFELVEEKQPLKTMGVSFDRVATTIGSIKQNNLPTKVLFNEEKRTTVVFFGDGDKKVVHCAEEDNFDKRVGFLEACFQKFTGLSKKDSHELMESLIPKEDKPIEEEKVFSIYQWISSVGYNPKDFTWIYECDGKTVEECGFYSLDKNWLVSRSEYKPYVEENDYIPRKEV